MPFDEFFFLGIAFFFGYLYVNEKNEQFKPLKAVYLFNALLMPIVGLIIIDSSSVYALPLYLTFGASFMYYCYSLYQAYAKK